MVHRTLFLKFHYYEWNNIKSWNKQMQFSHKNVNMWRKNPLNLFLDKEEKQIQISHHENNKFTKNLHIE